MNDFIGALDLGFLMDIGHGLMDTGFCPVNLELQYKYLGYVLYFLPFIRHTNNAVFGWTMMRAQQKAFIYQHQCTWQLFNNKTLLVVY